MDEKKGTYNLAVSNTGIPEEPVRRKNDAAKLLEQLSDIAMEIGYGSFCCRFTVHDGQIRGAEEFERARKLRV